MNEDDREALIDELLALEDHGQAIDEPYVEIAARRCLRLIGVEDYLHEQRGKDLEE